MGEMMFIDKDNNVDYLMPSTSTNKIFTLR